MDATTAFLHPGLDQDNVLMHLPGLSELGGLSASGIQLLAADWQYKHSMIMEALYGLKQALDYGIKK